MGKEKGKVLVMFGICLDMFFVYMGFGVKVGVKMVVMIYGIYCGNLLLYVMSLVFGMVVYIVGVMLSWV